MATDIVAAKDIVSTVILEADENTEPWNNELLSRVVDHWGYEFTPDEVTFPYEVGGWMYHMDDGYNALLPWIDQKEDTEVLLTRLSRLPLLKTRKRILELHKKHADYISDIASMGLPDDKTPYAWSRMVSSALLMDYKTSEDIVLLRKRILKRRQDIYEKPVDLRNNEVLLNMYKITESVKDDNWYIPLQKSLSDMPSGLTFEPPKENIGGRFTPADYHFVAYGSASRVKIDRVNISRQSTDEEEHLRKSLGKVFPKGLVTKDDIIYAITYGRHPAEFYKQLQGKGGIPMVNNYREHKQFIEEHILKQLKEYNESNSFINLPNIGIIGSVLDSSQEDQLSSYGGDKALYYAFATSPYHHWCSERPTLDVVLMMEGILQEYISTKEPELVQILDLGEEETIPTNREQTLEYFKSMIQGFNRAVEIGYNPPGSPAPSITLSGDGYDWDSDDGATGGLFGEDEDF